MAKHQARLLSGNARAGKNPLNLPRSMTMQYQENNAITQ